MAIIIASTRVIIVAHFISDIFGGVLVAYLCTIFVRNKFSKNNKLFNLKEKFYLSKDEVNQIFKNLNKIYEIIYESLKIRDDKFKLYQLLEDNNENRVAKVNFGKLLISEFGKTDLTASEKIIKEDIESIKEELIKEEKEKELAEEKILQ